MNKLIAILKRFMKTGSTDENQIETAAIPGKNEPEELHRGKRRLKENYTSHWDLDYLPRKELDEIMAELEPKKSSR